MKYLIISLVLVSCGSTVTKRNSVRSTVYKTQQQNIMDCIDRYLVRNVAFEKASTTCKELYKRD